MNVLSSFLSSVDSPDTRRAYRRWLGRNELGVADLSDLTGAALAKWYRRVVEDADLAPNTTAQRVHSMRSLLSWSRAVGEHQLSEEVVRQAMPPYSARPVHPVNVATREDVRALLGAAQTVRDRCILMLMAGAGLTATEVRRLDCSDLIDTPGGAALNVKLGRSRIVPVHSDTRAAVQRSLAEEGRRPGDGGPLFIAADRAVGSRPPGRITECAIRDVVRRTSAAAGREPGRITPSSLRKYFQARARRARRDGVDDAIVNRLLGLTNSKEAARRIDDLGLDALRRFVPVLPEPS